MPIGPDPIDKAMMKEKFRSFSSSNDTHVTAYVAVNCIMEIHSKANLEVVETITGNVLLHNQEDIYYTWG